jgi:hypothetical protein
LKVRRFKVRSEKGEGGRKLGKGGNLREIIIIRGWWFFVWGFRIEIV